MLRVGVIGATGYTGEEIIKVLARHGKAKVTLLQAMIDKEESIARIFPSLLGKIALKCEKHDIRNA